MFFLKKVMKGSGGSKKSVKVVHEAWRPTDGVRNGCGDDSPGYEHLLYHRGGGRRPCRVIGSLY
jgi:hypothetical protein